MPSNAPRLRARLRFSSLSPMALAVLLGLAGCAVLDAGEHPVTPPRALSSTDTGTAAAGTVEVEFGVDVDPADGRSVPVAINYGFDEVTEVSIGLSAGEEVELPGRNARGLGDAELGLRRRVWESDAGLSAALQVGVKLPLADEDEGLGSGEVDLALAGVLTHAPDAATLLNAYYQTELLGDPAGSGVEVGHFFALSATRDLSDRLGVYGELSQAVRPMGEEPLELLLGATHPFGSGVVVDVGTAVPLNGDAGDVRILAGLTLFLGAAPN